MAGTQIQIPDFDFSGFYYPEILEALIQFKRVNVPELTDESQFEPLIQFLRAVALVGHLNNTLTDLVANESTLPTAKLVETVRNMFRLIDFELAPASPAQVDLVYELAKVFASSATLIPLEAQAATVKQGNEPVVFFEALTALVISPTNALTHVLAEENSVFTDFTTEGNSPTTPADDFTPWATPAVGDKLYMGHAEIMWDQLNVGPLTVLAAGITGVYEYFDDDFTKTAPIGFTAPSVAAVTVIGSTLRVDLTSYLGTQNRQGTDIRVQLNETAVFANALSQFDGANFVTVSLLGQSTPATDGEKYTVGSDWEILADVVDETVDFTVGDKAVTYPIPQTIDRDWKLGDVDGKSAFWLRYRIVDVTTPTAPSFQGLRIDQGKQFAKRLATQGRSVEDSPLASSTGLPSQELTTSRDFFVNGSDKVFVDGVQWDRVTNFLASAPTENHYTVELGENDRATFKFGDGVTGRIPPLGVNNVRSEYRIGANDNGNVGARTVTVDKTGLSFVSKVFNPRQATGWAQADGADEASLEQVKIEGPASLRTREVAIGPNDVEKLAVAFTDATGAKPFSRVRAFEEGFGPKTIEATVVAGGGGPATAGQLAALDLFFNGDQFASPPVTKHLVANQEVTSTNFTPRVIDIVATVFGNVTVAQVVNRLSAIIHPEALKEDGVTFEWDFGGEIDDSRISHEIFGTEESITKVNLTTPSGPTVLLGRELPVLGTVSITIVEP